MFFKALSVRMSIFITIEQCEKNFLFGKILQVGGKEKEPGSFSFPPPTSFKHEFYGLTSGFTRLIMKSKYACYGLISLHVDFHDNRTK